MIIGGGSGIRTHGADEGTTVFKTVTINQTLPSLLCLNAYSIWFLSTCKNRLILLKMGCADKKVRTKWSINDLLEKYALNDPSAIELFKSLHEKHKVLLDTMTKH